MMRRHTEGELYPLGRPMQYEPIRQASAMYDVGVDRLRELEERFNLPMWDRSPTAPVLYRQQIHIVETILRPATDAAWEKYHTKSLELLAPVILAAVKAAGGRMTLSALRQRCRPAGNHLNCNYTQAMARLRHVSTVRISGGRVVQGVYDPD